MAERTPLEASTDLLDDEIRRNRRIAAKHNMRQKRMALLQLPIIVLFVAYVFISNSNASHAERQLSGIRRELDKLTFEVTRLREALEKQEQARRTQRSP